MGFGVRVWGFGWFREEPGNALLFLSARSEVKEGPHIKSKS